MSQIESRLNISPTTQPELSPNLEPHVTDAQDVGPQDSQPPETSLDIERVQALEERLSRLQRKETFDQNYASALGGIASGESVDLSSLYPKTRGERRRLEKADEFMQKNQWKRELLQKIKSGKADANVGGKYSPTKTLLARKKQVQQADKDYKNEKLNHGQHKEVKAKTPLIKSYRGVLTAEKLESQLNNGANMLLTGISKEIKRRYRASRIESTQRKLDELHQNADPDAIWQRGVDNPDISAETDRIKEHSDVELKPRIAIQLRNGLLVANKEANVAFARANGHGPNENEWDSIKQANQVKILSEYLGVSSDQYLDDTIVTPGTKTHLKHMIEELSLEDLSQLEQADWENYVADITSEPDSSSDYHQKLAAERAKRPAATQVSNENIQVTEYRQLVDDLSSRIGAKINEANKGKSYDDPSRLNADEKQAIHAEIVNEFLVSDAGSAYTPDMIEKLNNDIVEQAEKALAERLAKRAKRQRRK